MVRYSPEEYLAAIGDADAVDDNGFRRIDRTGGNELSMTRFLVFLETGRAGAESRDCDWSGKEGNGC